MENFLKKLRYSLFLKQQVFDYSKFVIFFFWNSAIEKFRTVQTLTYPSPAGFLDNELYFKSSNFPEVE